MEKKCRQQEAEAFGSPSAEPHNMFFPRTEPGNRKLWV